jgi:hypothetical protein
MVMRREYNFSNGIRGKHSGQRLRILGATSSHGGGEPDVTRQILETSEVRVSWLYEGNEAFLYNSVPGTIIASAGARTLRFELKEKNGDDENFEAVIKPKNGSYVLNADHPTIENREFPLKVYLSADELVLYLEDANNRAYFHLS